MTTPLDRTNRLHALASTIRQAVSHHGARPARPQVTKGRGAPQGADFSPTALIERARRISGNHPQRGRQALRVFIEGILLNEFGEQLITDPAFQSMVDEVLSALEASPQHAHDMQVLTQTLLGGQDQP